MHIVIKGVIPPKKNSKQIITRGSRQFIIPSKRHQEWEAEHLWTLKKYRPNTPIEHCEIAVDFYLPDNRSRDLSNMFESIADLLVKVAIIKDDNWKVLETILLYARGVDKDNPRVELYITELSTPS